jgi:tetratricopeptide (TPR) repeat protein
LSPTRERLERKSLKQDELLNFVSRATDYVGAHSNLVLGVVAGVVAVIVLGVLWNRGHVRKASESDQRFAQVVAAFASGQYQPALDLAAGVQSTYPGTRAAALSTYFAGKAQLQLGKFAEAEQSFRLYLDRAAQEPFYDNAARSGLAASLEAQGRYADAAAAFQEVAGKLTEPLASEARLDAARALRLAGSIDAARALLQQVAGGKTPELASVARQAQIELAVLDSAPRAAEAAPAVNP